MNQRIIPEPSEQKISSKLVPFRVTTPVEEKFNSRRYWLIAGAVSLLIVAITAAAWWAFAERGTIHYVSVLRRAP